MRNRTRSLGLALMVMASQAPAFAAEPVAANAPASQAVVARRAVLLGQDEELPYPPQARREGHQGLVKLGMAVQSNGEPTDIKLILSSRSSVLDDAAMQAARTWRFLPARDANGQAIATRVIQPVMYRKDSEDSLPNKKCSDLNTDLAWFKTAYAELSLSKMPVYELSLNVLLSESGPSSEKGEAINAAYPQAFERALARCAAQPGGLYWDALKSELPGKR